MKRRSALTKDLVAIMGNGVPLFFGGSCPHADADNETIDAPLRKTWGVPTPAGRKDGGGFCQLAAYGRVVADFASNHVGVSMETGPLLIFSFQVWGLSRNSLIMESLLYVGMSVKCEEHRINQNIR